MIKSFGWTDVSVCPRCKHYLVITKRDDLELCTNPESPYYSAEKLIDNFGTYLEMHQELGGCEKFMHNGKKIRADLLSLIPDDSFLRTVPLKELVEGYSEGMNTESRITTEQLVKMERKWLDDFIAKFEKYGHADVVDGKIVFPGEKV